MSGIVAAHGPFDPRAGLRMLERIAHRGPDGAGSRTVGDAWLGHRRLAIVDPEGGGQPLRSHDDDLWIVGDGEIYNHERLRARLGEHRFRTRSDHEAALLAYADEDIHAFDRLWGTFALVIAGEDGRFVATRDALGVAPLYYAQRDETTIFASELKAFDEDWRPLAQPLPAGHAWSPAEGLRPWRPTAAARPVLMRSRGPHEMPPPWVFDAVRDTLIRAVERALAADVPVGLLLSGGLDSSLITAIAARIAQRDGRTLPTFAAGLPGSPDLAAARVVAEHVGTDHHELEFSLDEAIATVPEVIAMLESYDPSLVHSAVPNHLVAGLASRHVKVVLIGEGADELFAGYAHYAAIETGDELHAELLDTIGGMHNLGLQRVDRVASANGVEPRIPFLDLDVVELALALPPAWKLTTEERPEKWLLRRAFEGWLPDEVLWRPKEQFGEGTGMNEALAAHFGAQATEEELERERDAVTPPLRTREELVFHRLLTERLPGIADAGVIGRFLEEDPATGSPTIRRLRHRLQGLYERHREVDPAAIVSYYEPGRGYCTLEETTAGHDRFAISIATIGGETIGVGDDDLPFPLQSVSKVFAYALALEDLGRERMLQHVGVEPSGDAFNSILFDERHNRPYNPMVNAGAIATTDLVRGYDVDEKLERIVGSLREFAGNPDLDVDPDTLERELRTADHNRATAYLMRAQGMIAGDVEATLRLYLSQCSVHVTCRDLAVMGATLANGGVNPVTGRACLPRDRVRDVLSVMYTCGMYDFAGQWAYEVGVPAKSGVSGAILCVIPGKMGIAVFSPGLDAYGNSVRGTRVCREISDRLGLHVFATEEEDAMLGEAGPAAVGPPSVAVAAMRPGAG